MYSVYTALEGSLNDLDETSFKFLSIVFIPVDTASLATFS